VGFVKTRFFSSSCSSFFLFEACQGNAKAIKNTKIKQLSFFFFAGTVDDDKAANIILFSSFLTYQFRTFLFLSFFDKKTSSSSSLFV